MPVDNFNNVAIIMDPHLDQVAIAKKDVPVGTALAFNGDIIEIKADVKQGWRFAVTDIVNGDYVNQYGFIFGRSKGICKGELISTSNIESTLPKYNPKDFKEPAGTTYQKELLSKTFLGYVRDNSSVGTRNYYLVMPTSMCASETALQIALSLESKKAFQREALFDGIVAIPHTEGCGCDSSVSVQRLMLVLKGYLCHPNVGGCLIVDLGCEQTNYEKMYPYLKKVFDSKLKPIDWITIEAGGGVSKAKAKAEKIITSRMLLITNVKRKPCPLGKLIVGTECGASDTFSGITANPIIGKVVDSVISARGSAILSETTEMIGMFGMLLPRFRSLEVAGKFENAMNWYADIAEKLGVRLEDNLIPKNIDGGLINNYIKNLGAVFKGGRSVIEDVIDYGEPIKKCGLSIMQGPGNDLESVTGIVASGANIICFSTGQGTPTGNAICPVIKIASKGKVFKKLSDDMDFNGGRLLDEQCSIDVLAGELLDFVIDVASGKQTSSERLKQRQFQIWTAGKLSV